MQLRFTYTQTKTGMEVVFTLRCDVTQSDEETARFDYYDLKSPLDWVFEYLQGTTRDGTIAIRHFDSAEGARAVEQGIMQACQLAVETLAISEKFVGITTVTFEPRSAPPY